ncbi:MAG: hypothetical protein GX848_05050 [Clostridiales bacterium]|nr:hypothetical protein [Clostridiales bacterium]
MNKQRVSGKNKGGKRFMRIPLELRGEKMKVLKITAAAVVLCVLALLGACKGTTPGNTTTTRMTSTTLTTDTTNTMLNTEDGRISDTSDGTDNGLVGDIVTDVSDLVTTTNR